jgi:putative membrane protein
MTHDLKRYLLLASAAALLAACNKPHNATGATDSSAAVPSGAATVENVPPSGMPEANPAATIPTAANEAAAPDFVQKASVSDMFEIEASKLALKRSSSPEVKAFARMMIKDHTQSTALLKAAIKESGRDITPPAALPDDKQTALNDLTNADAKDFDKKFMDAQVDGHKATLDLMSRYANDGDAPAIKAFAAKVGPIVEHHLDRAKAIRDALK